MPKAFKAAASAGVSRESESEQRRPLPEEAQPAPSRPIPEVVQESANDLDVPTFLRRQAQKA